MQTLLLTPAYALIARIIVANIFLPIVFKGRVVDGNRRTERFLWQFLFTFLMAAVGVYAFGGPIIDSTFLIVVVAGFATAGGTFFSWKAQHLSLSRTSLFTFWDDLIPIALSFYFLQEGRFVTPVIGLGILMSLLAVIGFVWYDLRLKAERGELGPVPPIFYVYVATYSVIWGFSMFGQRYWSFKGMPELSFLAAWYFGALLMALIIFLFYKDPAKDQESRAPLSVADIIATFVVAVLVFTSLAVTFVAYKWPQIDVQPIIMTSEMLFPALIGLWIFKERKQFAATEWVFFALAAMGALLIVFSL